MPVRKPLTLLLATAAATAAVAGIGLAATPALASRSAPADQGFNLTYPVTGSTFIKKTNSSIPLGPGPPTSPPALPPTTLTPPRRPPPSTPSFKELGFVPVQ